MASFACPHLDSKRDYCRRLDAICVPGRPGCVLPDDTAFLVPWKERLEKKKKQDPDDDDA